ncbi:hypothetical protein [Kluyvera cryocrescens]|uniref:hypothetical protein n=1 Tax=Kluyvera cryocrescens TaxID=580 RepID=UPI00248AA52D|nr:hypothetical protein [Kluyvera cryocrescens]
MSVKPVAIQDSCISDPQGILLGDINLWIIKVSLLFGKDDFMCSLAGGIISWIRKYDNATTLPHRFLTIGKLCPT